MSRALLSNVKGGSFSQDIIFQSAQEAKGTVLGLRAVHTFGYYSQNEDTHLNGFSEAK